MHACLSSHKCRPPSLSELTPIIFYIDISYLCSEASKYLVIYTCRFNVGLLLYYCKICEEFLDELYS